MSDSQLTVLAGLPDDSEHIGSIDALSEAFEFLGRVDTTSELIEVGVDLVPDAVVVDASLTDALGELARELHDRIPASRLVVIAAPDEPQLSEAVRAGAFSIVDPSLPPSGLIDAVKGATRGESMISASVAQAVLDEMSAWTSADPDPVHRSPTLTLTEAEVLRQLAKGRSARQIADLHEVTARLVSLHVGYALAKLQLHLTRQRKLIVR